MYSFVKKSNFLLFFSLFFLNLFHFFLNVSELLPLTGSDAVENRVAVGGRGPGLHGPTEGAEAEGVQSSGEQPLQDAAAGRSAVVRVDD